MSDDRTYDTVDSGEIAFDGSDGDIFTWTPVTPVELIRMGVTATTATTFGSGLAINLDINSSDGDGTFTRGDADAGVIDTDSTLDAGLVNYIEPTSRIRLKPGDQLIFQQTEGMDAGDGVCWVEYRKLPWQSGSTATGEDMLVNTLEV